MLLSWPPGTGGGDVIAKALRNSTSTSLRELDLGSTSIDDKAAGSLAALLAMPGCKLERVVLSNTNITDAGAQLLCNALQVGGGVWGGGAACR
jgi:hypothetical protein